MRLLFMGSPAEVISPLQSLLEPGRPDTLIGVVSQPARPAGRKQVLTDPPVAEFAKANNIPCFQPEKASSPEFLETLRTLAPDVIITAAYGQILSTAFLQIPKRATVNIHPSLLPAYRGATPIPAALLDGCSETGVSVLFTVKALDAGAIIVQRTFAIDRYETNAGLTPRLFAASAPLLAVALDRLRDPAFEGVPQDESKVTFCRKIAKTDGEINWTKPALQLSHEHRAYQPWPGTYASLAGQRLVIEDLRIADDQAGALKPGEFILDKKHKALRAGTVDGQLLILRLKPAGSKSLDVLSFWNGAKIKDKGSFDLS